MVGFGLIVVFVCWLFVLWCNVCLYIVVLCFVVLCCVFCCFVDVLVVCVGGARRLVYRWDTKCPRNLHYKSPEQRA
jgi:hypothetical protein